MISARTCTRTQADAKASEVASVGENLAKMRDEPGVPESKESEPEEEPDTPNGAEFTNAADKTNAEVGMSGTLPRHAKPYAASPTSN